MFSGELYSEAILLYPILFYPILLVLGWYQSLYVPQIQTLLPL